MSGTASSSPKTTKKPTIRRRGGHINPAQFIYWGLGVITLFLLVGFIGSWRNDKKSEVNGGYFQMQTVNPDGSKRDFGKSYSMDSVARVNSHLKYNYDDTSKPLHFISKGAVDLYFPSCRRPGTWIHRYYCGEGKFDPKGLDYCNGVIKVFKAKKKKCK